MHLSLGTWDQTSVGQARASSLLFVLSQGLVRFTTGYSGGCNMQGIGKSMLEAGGTLTYNLRP